MFAKSSCFSLINKLSSPIKSNFKPIISIVHDCHDGCNCYWSQGSSNFLLLPSKPAILQYTSSVSRGFIKAMGNLETTLANGCSTGKNSPLHGLLLRVVCGYFFYIGGFKNVASGHIKNLVEKSIGSCKLMKIKNFDKILKSTNKLLFNRLSHPSSRTVEGCYQRLIDGLGVWFWVVGPGLRASSHESWGSGAV